ncbi:swa [Drosophila busckii]|uniref:Swa n=1 Tax=Drosophila busckii TaxID=30019 RepID=A0A0M3QZJ2_DROBS|nr:swa [Drosophila busckii]
MTMSRLKAENKRRSAMGNFQRHRSMPESLTPHGNAEDQQKLDESLSLANSSETDTHVRDESYERLVNEKEQLKYYNDFLESDLQKKMDDMIVLRKSFNAVRTELMECKDKLKRQSATTLSSASMTFGGRQSSLRSLLYYPPAMKPLTGDTIAKATQTDLTPCTACANLSDLSVMPAIAANATPHPNVNMNDITYDSSAGSIEMPLLSMPPAVRQLKSGNPIQRINMKPLSLNFSRESTDVDANGNSIIAENSTVNSLQPSSSNRIATNNSGSSHPSSNDSAIEIESRSPQPAYHSQPALGIGQMIDSCNQECMYFDRRNNCVIKVMPLSHTNATTGVNTSSCSRSFSVMPLLDNTQRMQRRKKSLVARMRRILGSCVRCEDSNQTMDNSNGTYTVGISLLSNESDLSQNVR